jgi:hypothetical protein
MQGCIITVLERCWSLCVFWHPFGCRRKHLPCPAVRAGRLSAATPWLLLMPSTLVARRQQPPTQQPSLQLTQVRMQHHIAFSKRTTQTAVYVPTHVNLTVAALVLHRATSPSCVNGLVTSFTGPHRQAVSMALLQGACVCAHSFRHSTAQTAALSRRAYPSVHMCWLLVCFAAGGDEAQGLAAAIAEVSCEGGASAEAFARALSQSIQRDPTTGCDVLVTASSYAFATCGPTGAFADAGSTVTRVSAALGVCWLAADKMGNSGICTTRFHGHLWRDVCTEAEGCLALPELHTSTNNPAASSAYCQCWSVGLCMQGVYRLVHFGAGPVRGLDSFE